MWCTNTSDCVRYCVELDVCKGSLFLYESGLYWWCLLKMRSKQMMKCETLHVHDVQPGFNFQLCFQATDGICPREVEEWGRISTERGTDQTGGREKEMSGESSTSGNRHTIP